MTNYIKYKLSSELISFLLKYIKGIDDIDTRIMPILYWNVNRDGLSNDMGLLQEPLTRKLKHVTFRRQKR